MDNFNEFLSTSQRLEDLREQNHRNNREFQEFLKKFNAIKGFIELVLPKIFKDFADSINHMNNLQQTRLNTDNIDNNNSNISIVRFDRELRWKFFSIKALIMSVSQTLTTLETYTTTTDFEQNYRSIFNTTVRNDCDLNEIINDLKNSIDFARRITTTNQDDSLLSINSNDNVGTSSPI